MCGGLLFHTFFAFPHENESIENHNYALMVFAPRLDASKSELSTVVP